MAGDLNVHLADKIKGTNKDKLTLGGSMLLDFLDNENYELINATDLVINGPNTRYDPSSPDNEEKKSALDLFIISKDLLKHVDSLEIDKNLTNTPAKVTRNKVTFTDHYSCTLTLKNIPLKSKTKVKNHKTIFNTNKEGGWESYYHLTSNNYNLKSPKVLENDDPDEIM